MSAPYLVRVFVSGREVATIRRPTAHAEFMRRARALVRRHRRERIPRAVLWGGRGATYNVGGTFDRNLQGIRTWSPYVVPYVASSRGGVVIMGGQGEPNAIGSSADRWRRA